jgi:hypothetical protein
VSFVDDDNWVAYDWVANVDRIMTENELLGAVDGLVDPVFEKPPPPWFDRFKVLYAVVTETEPPRPPICPCGAGLNIRKAARQELVAGGFRPLISGRVGNRLSSGEDSELTHALRLAGWQLAIDNRLRMQHWTGDASVVLLSAPACLRGRTLRSAAHCLSSARPKSELETAIAASLLVDFWG